MSFFNVSHLVGNIPTMVVNRAMASQPMCVSRLRNMVEPLYSNPQKDPSTVEALKNTQVPPPFEVPEEKEFKEVNKEIKEVNKKIEEVNKEIKEENKEIKKESPMVTIIAPAVTSEVTGNHINESVKNIIESGGWELVHEEPPVDIFMDEIQPVQPDNNSKGRQPNGMLQHNTIVTTVDDKSSPSSGSAAVRTYTPLTNSSEEEGTASEPDSENLEDSTLGMLRPKKKHAFNAPDLFKNTWNAPKRADNSDALSVSDWCTYLYNITFMFYRF